MSGRTHCIYPDDGGFSYRLSRPGRGYNNTVQVHNCVHYRSRKAGGYLEQRRVIGSWSDSGSKVPQKQSPEVHFSRGDSASQWLFRASVHSFASSSLPLFAASHIMPRLQGDRDRSRMMHGYPGRYTRDYPRTQWICGFGTTERVVSSLSTEGVKRRNNRPSSTTARIGNRMT